MITEERAAQLVERYQNRRMGQTHKINSCRG